jgi:putative beta-lysine N-acetyltransferase
MNDIIEKIGKSLVQHGSYNNRVYLMKLHNDDYPEIIKRLESLALQKSYTKLFVKVPSWLSEGFESEGYRREASIPNFYKGKYDATFLAKYLDNNRSRLDNIKAEKIDTILELANEKKGSAIKINKRPRDKIRRLRNKDVNNLASLYSKVFISYPFPIFDEEYLSKTMSKNILYYGVYHKERLIAASSAEMDKDSQNAEMTDFATDPDYAGNNLSLILLRKMEDEMIGKNMKVLYTIARAFSPGMNITFAKQNYDYSGTLINNTNIYGKIESMNVWYKLLNS